MAGHCPRSAEEPGCPGVDIVKGQKIDKDVAQLRTSWRGSAAAWRLISTCSSLDEVAAPLEPRHRASQHYLGREGRLIETDPYEHVYPATDLLNKFVPIVVEVRARSLSEFSELIRHPGEEYTFVLEGTVELHTDLYAPVTLEVGDSIYFDSGMGHVYLLAGPGPCRVLSICSGEESQLIAALAQDPPATGAEPTNAPLKPVKTIKALKPADRRRAGVEVDFLT